MVADEQADDDSCLEGPPPDRWFGSNPGQKLTGFRIGANPSDRLNDRSCGPARFDLRKCGQ